MLKVFLVDDDAIVIDGLKMLVPWEDLNTIVVGEAYNGKAALDQIAAKRPDLIITDIKMPVLDGLELCRKVHTAMADTPVILMSAYEDFEYAKTAIQYGVKDYIIKPINRQKVNQLVDKIKEISERFDRRNQLYSEFGDSKTEERLIEALKTADESYIRSYFGSIFSIYDKSSDLILELCFKLTSKILKIAEKINLSPEMCGIRKKEIVNRLFALKTKDEMKELVLKIYLDTMRYIHNNKGKRPANIVEEIDSYILNTYTDPNLTIGSVAERFGITASYISIIFHQYKGLNVSSYITLLRMNQAKELLRNQQRTVSEVCRLSGYSDVHYFSKAFKKSEGITPSEYRSLSYNISKSSDVLCIKNSI